MLNKIFMAFAISILLSGCGNDQQPAPSAKIEQPKPVQLPASATEDDGKTFDLTLDDFVKRFNSVVDDAGFKIKPKAKKTNEGAKGRLVTQLETDLDNVAFLVEAKPSGKITSIIMLGTGSDAEPMKGFVNLLVSMTGMIGALDDSIRKDDRADVLMKGLKIDDAEPGKPYRSEYTKNGVFYNYSVSQATGLMLSASPQE